MRVVEKEDGQNSEQMIINYQCGFTPGSLTVDGVFIILHLQEKYNNNNNISMSKHKQKLSSLLYFHKFTIRQGFIKCHAS